MTAFRLKLADPQLQPEQRLAVLISGWLVGSDDSMQKLPVAISTFHVRNLISRYLAETEAMKRAGIYSTIREEEAATPETVSKILFHMKPPIALHKPVDPEKLPGLYELSVTVLTGGIPVRYRVQLPPEYDPYRKYQIGRAHV